MILCKNNVPDVYTKSEDYLCVLRLLDLVSNTEYQKNKINKILDPMMCPYEMLPSLAKRMGYKYDNSIPIIDNRIIMSAFPIMIKNKGSKLGIELAIKTAIKLSDHIKNISGISSYSVQYISNDEITPYDIYKKKIKINLYCLQYSRKLIELINYVRPAGYKIIITAIKSNTKIEAPSIKIKPVNEHWSPRIIVFNGSDDNSMYDSIIADVNATEMEVFPSNAFKLRFAIILEKAIQSVEVHTRLTYSETIGAVTTLKTVDICTTSGQGEQSGKTFEEITGVYEGEPHDPEWNLLVSDSHKGIIKIEAPESGEYGFGGYRYQYGVAILNENTIADKTYKLISIDDMYIKVKLKDNHTITQKVNQLGL